MTNVNIILFELHYFLTIVNKHLTLFIYKKHLKCYHNTKKKESYVYAGNHINWKTHMWNKEKCTEFQTADLHNTFFLCLSRAELYFHVSKLNTALVTEELIL